MTLLEFKTQARQRADMVDSQFISDEELTTYINASLAELHDLLIAAYNEDYRMEESIFATSGTISYPLPADLYKLRGVDARSGNDNWVTVKRFNFNRRNEEDDQFAWNLLGLPDLKYRLVGSEIRFSRTPDNNTSIRLFYHPKCETLVNDTDSYDDVNHYGEYVVVDAAIKMLNKEESDVSVLMAQKEALRRRIEGMAQNRDANEPESVTDIYAENADVWWTRGGT